jgi:hypothetical protein
MNKDLEWLVKNVDWPSDDMTEIGLDKDGEVRFDIVEYDFYPDNAPAGLVKGYFNLGAPVYSREAFMNAKKELAK